MFDLNYSCRTKWRGEWRMFTPWVLLEISCVSLPCRCSCKQNNFLMTTCLWKCRSMFLVYFGATFTDYSVFNDELFVLWYSLTLEAHLCLLNILFWQDGCTSDSPSIYTVRSILRLCYHVYWEPQTQSNASQSWEWTAESFLVCGSIWCPGEISLHVWKRLRKYLKNSVWDETRSTVEPRETKWWWCCLAFFSFHLSPNKVMTEVGDMGYTGAPLTFRWCSSFDYL